MAVQIPTLRRVGAPEPQSVGRMDVDLPDTVKPQAAINTAIENFAQAEIKVINKAEDDAIDLTATRAAAEYESKYKVELGKAKLVEGDPTEVYSKFDEDEKTWQDEILNRYEGASERTKEAIRNRMQKTSWSLLDQKEVSRALQYSKFDESTTTAAIKLKQDNMLSAVEIIDAKNPESFMGLRQAVADIQEIRYGRGSRNGLMIEDEDGNKKPTKTLQLQIKKDLSEGLTNAISTLNAVGKVDEAQMLMDEYKEVLTADDQMKLTKENKSSAINNQALMEIEKVKFLSNDEAMSKLDKISNLEVREKAQEKLDALQRRKENAVEREQKVTYENLADYVKGKDFLTVSELEEDPVFRGKADRLSAKGRKDIEAMIEKPKESNPVVLEAAYNKLFTPQFANMTYPELMETTAGLSEKHKTMFEKKWQDAKEQTAPEQRQMIQYMGKSLERELLRTNIVKSQRSGRGLTKESVKKKNQIYSEMMEAIDSFPPGYTPLQQEKWVKDYVTSYIKEEAFTGSSSSPPRFQSAPPASRGTVTPPKADERKEQGATRKLTPAEKQEAAVAWLAAKGRPWSSKTDTVMELGKVYEASKKPKGQ